MRPLLLVAAVLGLLLPTVPAQADTWSHRDDAGDVWLWGRGPQEAAPANETADVTRVVVRHQAKRVVLRSTVRRLDASGWGLAWSIRTDRRPKPYTVQLSRYAADAGGNAFRLVYGLDERGESTPVRCRGLDRSVNRRTGTVTVVVPRSCLASPRWVRAGVLTAAENGVDDEMSFYDDGLVDGYTSYLRTALGPRVRR